MSCVVDASFALSLVMPDEVPPSDQVMTTILNNGALVPAHWPTEVVNACVMAVRRGRLVHAEIIRALGDLAALEFEICPADVLERSGSIVDLALKHGLSVYDTAYLELAVRHHLPLATNDKRLAEAARVTGIRLL